MGCQDEDHIKKKPPRCNISPGSTHVALLTFSVATPLDSPIPSGCQSCLLGCVFLFCHSSAEQAVAQACHSFSLLHWGELGESVCISGGISVRALEDKSRPLSTHMLSSLTAGKGSAGSRTHVEEDHDYTFSFQMFKGPVDHKSPGERCFYEGLSYTLRASRICELEWNENGVSFGIPNGKIWVGKRRISKLSYVYIFIDVYVCMYVCIYIHLSFNHWDIQTCGAHTYVHMPTHLSIAPLVCRPVTHYCLLSLTPLGGQDSGCWGNRLSKPIKQLWAQGCNESRDCKIPKLFLQLASSSVHPQATRLGANLGDQSPRVLSTLLCSSCPSLPADGWQ